MCFNFTDLLPIREYFFSVFVANQYTMLRFPGDSFDVNVIISTGLYVYKNEHKGLILNVYIIVEFEGAPTAPLGVTAVASSSTAIDVTWTEPNMPNGVIRRYQVTYTRNDVMDTTPQTVDETSTAVQLTDLEKFANYTIFVQGFTVELGAQSDPVTARTDEDSKYINDDLIAIAICCCCFWCCSCCPI